MWLTEPDGPGWWFVAYFGEIEIVRVDPDGDAWAVGHEVSRHWSGYGDCWMKVSVPAVPEGY